MDVLANILDWRQILNSFVGSVLAVLIFGPGVFWLLRWAGNLIDRYKHFLAAASLLLGIGLILCLAWPAIYLDYLIISQARTFGGDEPRSRVHFSCEGDCHMEVSDAAEICLDSSVQFNSEVIGHYGSRNRAGLKIFVDCMRGLGYAPGPCESELLSCVIVPDIGYRNYESTIHYSAECSQVEEEGVRCDYDGEHKEP